MGGDGGSIPGRQDLVRMKKKKEVMDKNEELAATWRHCSLSHDPLREPIVACEKGKLFNKEAILEHLLEKGDNEAAKHIRSLKDVKQLNLTPNPAYKGYDDNIKASNGGVHVDYNLSPYSCPVIGLEMNGRWRFIFLWGCGCVLSEKAMLELKSEKCHKCGKAFSRDDVIVLNGTGDDLELMESKMVERRERSKAEKKNKKNKRKGEDVEVKEEPVGVEGEGGKVPRITNDPVFKKEESGMMSDLEWAIQVQLREARKNSSDSPSTSSSNPALKKLKEAKDIKTTNSSKLASTSSTKTVQDDPNKSEVYKSLFTSHSSHKNQPTAHWVTMNPGYYR